MPVPIRCYLALGALLLTTAFSVAAQHVAPRPPLQADEVVRLLSEGVSPKRVATLVSRLGIAFELDEARERVLRAAGADQDVIDAVRAASAPAAASPEPPEASPAPEATPSRPASARQAPGKPPDGDFVPVPGRPGVYIAAREVTRREYLGACARWHIPAPKDPPLQLTQRPQDPILNITWEAAQLYCARLSGETGRHYRLPTEAEWELAASGGNPRRKFPWPDGGKPSRYACFGHGRICPVGSLRSNGYGLFDMAGNAAEWVRDDAGKPVVKGGSWALPPEDLPALKISSRKGMDSREESSQVGFRLALER